MEKTEQKKPVHEEREGLVKAAVWENKGKNGTFHTVTFSRLYKNNGDTNWKSSHAFGSQDLPKITTVLDRVSTYLKEKEKKA